MSLPLLTLPPCAHPHHGVASSHSFLIFFPKSLSFFFRQYYLLTFYFFLSEDNSLTILCWFLPCIIMNQMNLFAGRQWRHRHREETFGHRRGRRGWDELREEQGSIHATIYRLEHAEFCCVTQGAQPGALRWPEGRDGEGDGRGDTFC